MCWHHIRLLCLPLSPGVCSNTCPLYWWCHPTISSSVIPSSSCLQSFPASGSFPMSQLFISGGQNTGASVSASILPLNIQDWFPLDWSPFCPRDSQEPSPAPQFEIISSSVLNFYMVQILHLHKATGKTIPLAMQIFVDKVMTLLFNMLSRFVIAFLPRTTASGEAFFIPSVNAK